MKKNLVLKITIILFCLIIILFIYSKISEKKEIVIVESNSLDQENENFNIIKDVSYISKDTRGNQYTLNASEGQIDLSNDKMIFLTKVKATINLSTEIEINISSNFGKYNIDNYDTIFSKNVIITYMDHTITGNYLDFSLDRNSMIISKNVVYTFFNKSLRADVIEIDINTKDTKIFMYDENEKISIELKN